MRVAYLINQYPKGSHTFIRREMLALERQGVEVVRIAVRGWDATLVDPADVAERECTRYLLRRGLPRLVVATVATVVRHPLRGLQALATAVRLGRRSDRGLAIHLVYFAEACLFAQWAAAERANHVHAHFGTNAATVALLAHRLGGPAYSFTVHGPEEFDKPEFLHLREKVERAAFAVAISAYGRSQLLRWVDPTAWNKVHVVHCGLEAAYHDLVATAVPETPRLVCIGRFSEQKGHLLLIEAARRLRLRGRRFELVLAGDGELREAIEAAIRSARLEGLVRITGWIPSDAVRDELIAARGLVLPSFAEGLPIVCMEAMALRRPVLATYVAGIPELVRDGREGYLFPAGDVEALVDAMDRFLALPLDRVAEMGESARIRALERHSIDTEAARLHTLFERAAAHDPVPADHVSTVAASR